MRTGKIPGVEAPTMAAAFTQSLMKLRSLLVGFLVENIDVYFLNLKILIIKGKGILFKKGRTCGRRW